MKRKIALVTAAALLLTAVGYGMKKAPCMKKTDRGNQKLFSWEPPFSWSGGFPVQGGGLTCTNGSGGF